MTSGSIGDRLKELAGDGSVNGFAKRCGIPGTTMRQYFEGSIPGADKMAQIAERTGVSLVWLITGSGLKYPLASEISQAERSGGFSEAQAPYAAGPDPELFGRIVDVVDRVHREEQVRLQKIDLGRISAEKYAEISAAAADRDEWPALLDLLAVRLRRVLRAAAVDPASSKRGA